MNIVKKIITPLFILLMSMTFFMQSVCALCDNNIGKAVTPKSVYYGLETTKIYHTSFQFRTSKNQLLSCVVDGYADSNIEICVYGNPVIGVDTYGKVSFNQSEFRDLDLAYSFFGGLFYTQHLNGNNLEYTFMNLETNDNSPLITMLLLNKEDSRFLNKTISVFGKTKTVNFKDKFMEIADMDGDNHMSLSDVMSIMEKYRDVQLFGMNYTGTKGDMNKDGTITMSDVQDALDFYTQVTLLV